MGFRRRKYSRSCVIAVKSETCSTSAHGSEEILNLRGMGAHSACNACANFGIFCDWCCLAHQSNYPINARSDLDLAILKFKAGLECY